MGTWLEGPIGVRTFTKEAFRKIEKTDLFRQFKLPGEFNARGNCLSYRETLRDVFDAETVVRHLSAELNGEGTVYAVYECEEDGPVAYTYYDLGDGVKIVYFSSASCQEEDREDDFEDDYDEENDDLYNSLAWHAALLHFDLAELREIYREAFSEFEDEDGIRPEDRTYEEMIRDLLQLMGECVYEAGESFFETPHLAKLLEQIRKNTEVCRFEDHDFEPNPGWEKKGYVKFSDVEKAYLKATDKMPVLPRKKPDGDTAEKAKSGSKSNAKKGETEEKTGRAAEPDRAEGYGEEIWHPAGNGRDEFRIFGYDGGCRLNVELRNAHTRFVLSRDTYDIDLSDYPSEDGYGISTDYAVENIEVLSDDQCRFDWRVTVLKDGEETGDVLFEIVIDLPPAEEKESESADSERMESENEEFDTVAEAADVKETQQPSADQVSEQVKELFRKQIREKEAERDKLQQEIELLEEMLRKM